MLLRKLIEVLEELEREELKHVEVMGEPEIMIDSFEASLWGWRFAGFSKDIEITRTADGVYSVLMANGTWEK